MNWRRIKAIAKLLLLFGTPVAAILGLFSCGVYCGATNQERVATFERNWLGFDVRVRGEAPKPKPDKGNEGEGASKVDAKAPESTRPEPPQAQTPDETPGQTPDKTPDGSIAGDDERAPPPKPAPKPAPEVQPVPVPVVPSTPPYLQPLPETRVDPLEGDAQGRLSFPTTITVAVLVDQGLVADLDGWIDLAQHTVRQASRVYEAQFGIELELVEVARWNLASAGMSEPQLGDDLRQQTRIGADIVLGLTQRAKGRRLVGAVDVPVSDDDDNASFAVVYPMNGQPSPYLRPTLRAIAMALGAQPSSESLSWMGSATKVDPELVPWIGPANRRKVLERKDKPFRPRTPPPSPSPEDESTDETEIEDRDEDQGDYDG